MSAEVAFTRTVFIAGFIERLIRETNLSLDAALYRLNYSRLADALRERAGQGVRIRLILDRGKYEEDPATREILAANRIPFRLGQGRRGPGSKMHHKFAILDQRMVITGSYNWTRESEEENCENVLVLREPLPVGKYIEEFEALWKETEEHV